MNDPLRPLGSTRSLRKLLERLRWPLPWRPGRPGEDDTHVPRPRDVAAQRLRAQVRVVQDAFRGDIALGPAKGSTPPRDPAEAAYLYRPGYALIRTVMLPEVAEYLRERGKDFDGELREPTEPLPGLSLVRLPPRADKADSVLATLDEIDDAFGEYRNDPERWPIATPDHVMYVTIKGSYCPFTEPEMVERAEPWPPQANDQSIGDGVRVAVVDTGLWRPSGKHPHTPWMKGVEADPTDEEVVNAAAIHPYAGHGTFAAGVVRCVAPGAYVEVEGALPHGGAVYESAIIEQLDEALDDEDRPQLISISAGTHSRKNIALLSFEMLRANRGLDDGEQTIIIAAAGNDSSSDPFWPAAFPWVTGVGSVDTDGKVSDFSNYGHWVDVYARGRDIVNAFPVGTYVCYEPPHVGEVRTFEGLARWTGTSFSTPLVTGLVAASMSNGGGDAGRALAAVLASGIAGADPDGRQVTIVGPLT